uniref:TCDD-inducible poly [ADP-ribose] polymerase-like n=2 Tax=Callorhinchus milii TaxID=7868 RepID=A0A4W3GZ65_CALMI
MTVQDGGEFDRLRRLSTSDADPLNSFPTVWRYYWRAQSGWREYGKSLADYFEEALSCGLSERYFMSQTHSYRVDLGSSCQYNIVSGTKRDVRRRPFFQSVVTLLP